VCSPAPHSPAKNATPPPYTSQTTLKRAAKDSFSPKDATGLQRFGHQPNGSSTNSEVQSSYRKYRDLMPEFGDASKNTENTENTERLQPWEAGSPLRDLIEDQIYGNLENHGPTLEDLRMGELEEFYNDAPGSAIHQEAVRQESGAAHGNVQETAPEGEPSCPAVERDFSFAPVIAYEVGTLNAAGFPEHFRFVRHHGPSHGAASVPPQHEETPSQSQARNNREMTRAWFYYLQWRKAQAGRPTGRTNQDGQTAALQLFQQEWLEQGQGFAFNDGQTLLTNSQMAKKICDIAKALTKKLEKATTKK